MARKAYIGVGKQVPIYGQVEKELELNLDNVTEFFYRLQETENDGWYEGTPRGGVRMVIPKPSNGKSRGIGQPVSGNTQLKVELKQDLTNFRIADYRVSADSSHIITFDFDGRVVMTFDSETDGWDAIPLGDAKKGDVLTITGVYENSAKSIESRALEPTSYFTLMADPITKTVEDIVGYEEQGFARLVKSAYVGVNTEIPIIEKTEQPIPFNTANINKYFDVSNGSGTNGWEYSDAKEGDGVVFKPKNFGFNNSTASMVLTLKENLTNFKIVRYNIVTEASCDKFTINSNGTKVINAISGNKIGSNITLTGSGSGNTLNLVYAKDYSQHATGETRSYFVISADPITEVVETVVGHEMKEVARKIKKAYIGIGGVARPWLGYDPIEYYGEITPLSVARNHLAATTVGNYALFGGGREHTKDVSIVDAYNASLTRTTPTPLRKARVDLAATTVGNYAFFGGGYGDGHESTVDAYNGSLTRTTPTTLSLGRTDLAATSVGNYALFGGGSTVVDAYNSSLTRTTPTALSVGRTNLAATSVGNYALFGGGYDSACVNTVDAYNTSLTRTTPTPLSVARTSLAATSVGNYALFGGGSDVEIGVGNDKNAVDAYNGSLTRTTPATLNRIESDFAATTVYNQYAIFLGYNETIYDIFLTRIKLSVRGFNMSHLAATSVGNYALFGGGAFEDAVVAFVYNSRDHNGGTN